MSPGPGGAEASSRQALLIGIDEYPFLPPESRLQGAVNDAETLAALLGTRFAFATEVLTDEQATRAGILAGLDRLLQRTGPGDTVLLHFSGHGSRRRSPDNLRRGDRWEQILVPQDSAHRGALPNRGLSGRELYGWLRLLCQRTRRITLVLDCCNAGTLPRADRHRRLGRARTVDADERVQAPPEAPPDTPWWQAEIPTPGESGWLPVAASHTLIAACRAHELAREIDCRGDGVDRRHGALTAALLECLEEEGEGATYQDLLPRLTARVRDRFVDQHPQVEGAVHRRLFRLREGVARHAVHVRAHGPRGLVLSGGAIHGVQPGSRWAIREATTGGAKTLGHIRVRCVSGGRSDAVPMADLDPARLRPGLPAVPISPNLGPAASAVGACIADDYGVWRSELARRVDGSHILRWVGEPRTARLVVDVLPPRRWPSANDLAQGLGALEEPFAAIVAPQGRLLAPAVSLSAKDSVDKIVASLERLARVRQLEELTHPEPSPLTGAVELALLQRDTEGRWVEATSSGEGLARFSHGEDFCLRLRNTSPRPLHAYVLNLGVGGGISLLFPVAGAYEPLSPGKEVVVGGRPGDERFFEIPASLPYDAPGAAPWSGEEVFKLLVTEESADLSALFQPALRSSGAPPQGTDSELGDCLASILGLHRREVRAGESPRTLAWATQRLRITLRRPAPRR